MLKVDAKSERLPRHVVHLSDHLPILLDIEAPLELEVSGLVIVDKARHGLVVASAEHAGGCRL